MAKPADRSGVELTKSGVSRPKALTSVIGFVVLGGCLTACSLLVDFHDLTGSAADANATDADVGAPDAPRDSASDAIASDGGRVCAEQPASVIFCADFDGVDAGLSAFQVTSEHGTVTIDDAVALSPPGSLHITQQTIASDSEQNSADFSTTSSPTLVRLDLDFNFVTVGKLNPNTGQAIAAIFVAESGEKNEPTISVNVTSSTIFVVEVDPTTLDGEFHDAFPFSVDDGKWHHLSLLLDMSAAKATYTLTVDASQIETGPTFVTFAPGQVSGEIGLGYENPPGLAFDGHYDNIVIDTK